MPNLDHLISFPSPSPSSSTTPIPPSSSHIFVTDTLDSPASFVLVHFLRALYSSNRDNLNASQAPQSKGKSSEPLSPEKRIVWLSSDGNGLTHLKNLVRKSGINLDVEIHRGTFAYIDAQQVILQSTSSPSSLATVGGPSSSRGPPPALEKMYNILAQKLDHFDNLRSSSTATDTTASCRDDNPWEARNLVILDDLSALSWSLDATDSNGRELNTAAQVCQWVRAVRGVCAKTSSSFITLLHADATSASRTPSSSTSGPGASDFSDETLFRSQIELADVWIEVKSLTSGRARDCDGEICVHGLVRPSLAVAPSTTERDRSQEDANHGCVPPIQAFAIDTPCAGRARAMLYRIAPDGIGPGGPGSGAGRVQVWARGTGRGFL
ncbi:hypothetical protein IE53DRAFT_386787 [Violaceomyces palustris]|uniref:Uncharacterized protein n=1 Tax=Violaceomyces palustris TaxID=1673888 RepID=A0ACD0NYI2_9BASI|nr:hypothetical protein IE53DRAFT_386787 [Violaceomyces palustris]